jgi:hypothetical protein
MRADIFGKVPKTFGMPHGGKLGRTGYRPCPQAGGPFVLDQDATGRTETPKMSKPIPYADAARAKAFKGDGILQGRPLTKRRGK